MAVKMRLKDGEYKLLRSKNGHRQYRFYDRDNEGINVCLVDDRDVEWLKFEHKCIECAEPEPAPEKESEIVAEPELIIEEEPVEEPKPKKRTYKRAKK